MTDYASWPLRVHFDNKEFNTNILVMVDPEEKNARKQEKADLVEQLEDERIPFFRAVPGGTDEGTYINGENLV